MQLALWWLLHIIVIFSGITFPFKARSIRAAGRCRYVHVVMVTIGLIVPCVPVAVSFVRRGYGSVSPTFLCTPRDGAASFYSLVLPISIFLATGISMLVIMFVGITKVTSYSLISVWSHSLEQDLLVLFLSSGEWPTKKSKGSGSEGSHHPLLLYLAWCECTNNLQCVITEHPALYKGTDFLFSVWVDWHNKWQTAVWQNGIWTIFKSYTNSFIISPSWIVPSSKSHLCSAHPRVKAKRQKAHAQVVKTQFIPE